MYNLCFYYVLHLIYIWIENILSKFWSFFSVYSFCFFKICSLLYYFLLVIIDRQTFRSYKILFYSVLFHIHIYSEILYTKICRLCSRNCMEHIWVVPPKWTPYSFLNIIRIFLAFFFHHNKLFKSGTHFFFIFFLRSCHKGSTSPVINRQKHID